MHQSTIRTWTLTAALLLAAPCVVAGGRCYTAEIPQPIILPDGSGQAPGSLSLCVEQTFSPVSKMHRVELDGRPIGLFLSRPRGVEMSVNEGRAQFVFRRTPGGLVLMGYAVHAKTQATFFDMAGDGAARPEIASDLESGEDVVLVASGN